MKKIKFTIAIRVLKQVLLLVVLAGYLTLTPLMESHAKEVDMGVATQSHQNAQKECRSFAALPYLQTCSSITSMISGGFSISHGIQQGQLLSQIVNTLNTINTKIDQLDQKMANLSLSLTALQDTVNIKFDEVLNQARQAQLTTPQTKINEAYSQIFGAYASLSKESDPNIDKIKQRVQTVCGKWQLEGNGGLYEFMRLYNTVMTGDDMNASAIDSLTSLLITRMTLTNENSRITASNAMDVLKSFLTHHISIQGKGVLCIREIVFADQSRTLAENEKLFNDYLSNTIQGDFWKRQIALFHKSVGRILTVYADLSSQADRGPLPLLKEVKNSAGEVIFSHDIAEKLYSSAEFLACILLPSAYPPGLYVQIIGDPTFLRFTLDALLEGSIPMTKLDSVPVVIPSTPYLSWIGDISWSTIYMAMQSSLRACRYYYQTTCTGSWPVKVPLFGWPTRTIKAEYYDKETGAVATTTTKEVNKMLFGAALIPVARRQPKITWSLPVVHRLDINDPSITFYSDGNLASNVYKSYNSLAYCAHAVDVTSGKKNGRRFYERSGTSSQEIFNVGPTCRLSFGASVSMKVRGPSQHFRLRACNVSLELGWWKPPFDKWFYTDVGLNNQNKFNRWSVFREYVRGQSNFWGMMTWEPPSPNSELGFPVVKGGKTKIYMDFKMDSYWNSGKFGNASIICAYGSHNSYKADNDFETWSYPGLTFGYASVPSNALQGTYSSCAFGQLPASNTNSQDDVEKTDDAAANSCFFITFDPRKAKASMATTDYDIADTWKLMGTGRFSISENDYSVLFFDEQSRSFSHCQFPAPESEDDENKTDETDTIIFTDIAGLTLPKGTNYITTGDFSGDGMDDLLVGNPDTGEYQVYLINHSALAEKASITYDSSLGKPVFHVDDFNNDGTDDILAEFESAGVCHISLMKGVTVIDSGWVANSDMKLLAVADFNGDNKAEMLWHDKANRDLLMVYCDGLAIVNFEYTRINGNPLKRGYTIAQLGDFNGDGKTDILWRKTGRKKNKLFLTYMDGSRSLRKKKARSGPVKLALPTGTVFY